MRWFLNLSLRNKLFIGFGIILLCLVTIVFVAYNGMQAIYETQKILHQIEMPMSIQLSEFRSKINRQRLIMIRLASENNRENIFKYLKEMKEVDRDIDNIFQSLRQLDIQDASIKQQIQELQTLCTTYTQSRDTETIPLVYQQKNKEVENIVLGEHLTQYENTRDSAIKLTKISEERDKQFARRIDTTASNSKLLFIVVAVVAFGLSLLIIFYLVTVISVPLKRLSGVAERMAYGDLSMNIPIPERTDEIGILIRTVAMMISTLRSVTQEIRDITQNLTSNTNKLQKNIVEGVAENNPMAEKIENVTSDLQKLNKKLEQLIQEYKL